MRPVDRGYTLKPSLETSLKKYGDRQAVQTDEQRLTYRELDQDANAIANALTDFGIAVEDRVAVLMENRVEFVTSRVAIVKAGGALVPVNHRLTDPEVRHILETSSCKAVIVGPKYVDTVERMVPQLDQLEICIAVNDDADQRPDQFYEFTDLLTTYQRSSGPPVQPTPEDVASISFTGGTTGQPKGVVHTQRSRMMNMYAECIELEITGEDTMLLATPLAHAARLFLVAGLLAGATIVIRSGFDRDRFLEDIEVGVTWSFCVPTMIYRLLDSSAISASDTSSLRTLVYGAAPMAPDRLEEALTVLGPIFIQLYGQTEVPNLITTLDKHDHEQAISGNDADRLRSAGTPCMMTQVRVVDPDTGDVVDNGSIGEITVTCPYIMREYHGHPEKTAETLRDGWVYTGDIGKRTSEGYVQLLDRKANMIVTGGMNVYSKEVEDAIAAHPDVKDCAVIGVPDDDWGEAVKAVVVTDDNCRIDTADLRTFLDGSLASYKIPKRVECVEELPKTPYGKIDKSELE